MDALEAIHGLEWLYLFIILVGAAFVHGGIGMGFPLVFTALGALVLDVKTAVFISLAPAILINVQCLLHGLQWRALLSRFSLLAVCAGVGSIAGTKILLLAPTGPIKLVLVASIVAYLVLDRLGVGYFGWIRSRPTTSAVLFGLVAGLVGGITNAMGPILVVYFLEQKYNTDTTVQGLNFCFLVGKLAQLYLFIDVGHYANTSSIAPIAGITLLVMACLLVGVYIRKRLDVDTYRKTLKVALGIIAVVLLVQVVAGL